MLAGAKEPERFILAEERGLYIAAFPGGLSGDQESRSTIVRRFLQTHALIGLTDLTARYPIPAVEAAELLELWCEEGKVVRIGEDGRTGESRWAERGNLTEMRRATVAALRRESLAVQPEVFADFLLRRQNVHASTVGEGATAVERVLEQLQGICRGGVFVGERNPSTARQGLSFGLAGRSSRAGELVLASGRERSRRAASRFFHA